MILRDPSFRREFMTAVQARVRIVVLTIIVSFILDRPRAIRGADPAPVESEAEKQAAAERLDTMKSLAQACELSRNAPSQKPIVLESKPLLRWSNPISGMIDGSLWLWTQDGRPVATVDIFAGNKSQSWNHQMQSLSTEPFECKLDGQLRWTPQKPGLELKPVPMAGAPAKTAAARLVQMRAIARDFSVQDDFKTTFRGTEFQTHQLRLLAQPLYRYGREDQPVNDGAVFAFVLATACEALLIVESHAADPEPAWYYGLAGQTCYELRAEYQKQPVWSQPCWDSAFDSNNPYFGLSVRAATVTKQP